MEKHLKRGDLVYPTLPRGSTRRTLHGRTGAEGPLDTRLPVPAGHCTAGRRGKYQAKPDLDNQNFNEFRLVHSGSQQL